MPPFVLIRLFALILVNRVNDRASAHIDQKRSFFHTGDLVVGNHVERLSEAMNPLKVMFLYTKE